MAYTSVGLGEWLIMGDGYGAYDGRILADDGGKGLWL